MARTASIFSATIMMAILGMTMLTGCAGSSGMAEVAEPSAVVTSQPDKATIVFYRGGNSADTNHALLFDDSTDPPHLIGIINAGTKIAFVGDPGARRFMVFNERPDFMEAELAPGKTYYVELAPTGRGTWKERFALYPRRGDPDVTTQLSVLSWVENTPESQNSVASHMPSIMRRREAALPKWEKRPDRPILKADYGQVSPSH
jgi:hypothetical protein